MELYTKTSSTNLDVEVTTQPFTAHGITVPKGFEFDGASAPRFFWSIIPPFKRTKKASVIHDYLCRLNPDKEGRLKADKIFKEMLLEGGLSELRATIGYIGVRIGAYLGIPKNGRW